jgi:hypothetical protein
MNDFRIITLGTDLGSGFWFVLIRGFGFSCNFVDRPVFIVAKSDPRNYTKTKAANQHDDH